MRARILGRAQKPLSHAMQPTHLAEVIELSGPGETPMGQENVRTLGSESGNARQRTDVGQSGGAKTEIWKGGKAPESSVLRITASSQASEHQAKPKPVPDAAFDEGRVQSRRPSGKLSQLWKQTDGLTSSVFLELPAAQPSVKGKL